MFFHLLPLAALLTPGSTHSGSVTLPLMRPVVVVASIDTGAAADPAETAPLTSELVTHYIAVKKDLNDYWKAPANKALHDSALAHHHVHTVKVSVTGMKVPDLPVNVFDYVDLTSREPAIAAIFKKNSFNPAQFETTQISVMRASFASEVGRLAKKSIDDPTSVAGKNVALVTTQKDALTNVGAFIQLQAGGGGGGMGGGDDDLSP